MKIEDFLSGFHVEFRRPGEHKHARAGWLQLDCPKCGPRSGNFHLGFSIGRRLMNCWRCGPAPVVETLARLSGKPPGFVLGVLKGLPNQRIKRVQYSGTYQPPAKVGPMGDPHRDYLKDRGFDPEELERVWGLQGIGVAAKLKWRVFIPIHDIFGRAVSWTTRSVNPDSAARYISAEPSQELIHHKHLLYGERYCRHAAIIHEGPPDAWRTGPGAVATLGTGFTPAQCLRASKYPLRVICFDNEPAAQRRARQFADALSVFPGETIVARLESGKDSAEADEAEVAELRKYLL